MIFRKAVQKYKNLPVVARATGWFVICSLIQKGISFLTTPNFTRLMSTEQYGLFSVYTSWLQILTIISTIRLDYSVFNKGMSKYPEDRDGYASSMLGLTPEKLARAEHEYKVDRIHRLFGLDKKLVDKYMRMGYASHQVKRAMFLARHCDKSVEELLAMKTRQQKWGDICEQLGLPRDACMK